MSQTRFEGLEFNNELTEKIIEHFLEFKSENIDLSDKQFITASLLNFTQNTVNLIIKRFCTKTESFLDFFGTFFVQSILFMYKVKLKKGIPSDLLQESILNLIEQTNKEIKRLMDLADLGSIKKINPEEAEIIKVKDNLIKRGYDIIHELDKLGGKHEYFIDAK